MACQISKSLHIIGHAECTYIINLISKLTLYARLIVRLIRIINWKYLNEINKSEKSIGNLRIQQVSSENFLKYSY